MALNQGPGFALKCSILNKEDALKLILTNPNVKFKFSFHSSIPEKELFSLVDATQILATKVKPSIPKEPVVHSNHFYSVYNKKGWRVLKEFEKTSNEEILSLNALLILYPYIITISNSKREKNL